MHCSERIAYAGKGKKFSCSLSFRFCTTKSIGTGISKQRSIGDMLSVSKFMLHSRISYPWTEEGPCEWCDQENLAVHARTPMLSSPARNFT